MPLSVRGRTGEAVSGAEGHRHQDEEDHHAPNDPGGDISLYEQDHPDHPRDGPDSEPAKQGKHDLSVGPKGIGIEHPGLGQRSGLTPEPRDEDGGIGYLL